MKKSPILSVLVTFCKQKPYIDDCLRSMIEQKTQFPFEILAAVDGEDDGSMDLLASYAARYDFIHYWKVDSDPRLLPLSRASCNRLFLLQKARGKYFIMFDGDDFFCSHRRFEEGIRFLEENDDIMAHSCEWVLYDDSTKSFKTARKKKPERIICDTYLEKGGFNCAASHIFRNIFLTGETYPEKYFFDDTVLTTYMLSKGDFFFSAEQMFAYRIGIESTFYSKSLIERRIMGMTTTVIKRNMTAHPSFDRQLKKYIVEIQGFTEAVPASLRDQILFQEIPLVSNLIRLRETSDPKERRKEEKAIREFFCSETDEELPFTIITFHKLKRYISKCIN